MRPLAIMPALFRRTRRVLVERRAGVGSGFSDEAYKTADPEIVLN